MAMVCEDALVAVGSAYSRVYATELAARDASGAGHAANPLG
jgi:hypothetical protein